MYPSRPEKDPAPCDTPSSPPSFLTPIHCPMPMSAIRRSKPDHLYYAGELSCSTFERLAADAGGRMSTSGIVGTKATTDELEGSRRVAVAARRTSTMARRAARTSSGRDIQENESIRSVPANTGPASSPTASGICGFHACPVGRRRWRRILGHNRGRCTRRPGTQYLRGFSDRRALRQGQMGAARSRSEHRRLRRRRLEALLSGVGDPRQVGEGDRSQLQAGTAARLAAVRAVGGRSRAPTEITGPSSTSPATSGPPPMVHLRRGGPLRRYLEPGPRRWQDVRLLGPQARAPAASPARSGREAWVNQPEKMYGSKTTVPAHSGQARLRQRRLHLHSRLQHRRRTGEGVVQESDERRSFFEFNDAFHQLPRRRAPESATKPWGIYDKGCTNSLVLRGKTGGAGVVVGRPRSDLVRWGKAHRQSRPDGSGEGVSPIPREVQGQRLVRDSGLVITTSVLERIRRRCRT